MLKKTLSMSLALVVCLGILTGCNSGIKFRIGYDNKGGFGIKEENGINTDNLLEYVNSFQELKDLCDEWDNPAFQDNNEHFSSEISKKIRSYDEKYFEENILVVYSFWRGHRNETRVDSIDVEGEQLVINARYIIRRGTFDDVSFNWLILIEVNKADVTGVTSVQVKHK